MGLPRFFPENTIHRFQYRPMFYDEQKEDFERRVAEIHKEMGLDDAKDVRILQSGTFKRMYERRHEKMRHSSLRVMVLAGIIALILYCFNQYYNFI